MVGHDASAAFENQKHGVIRVAHCRAGCQETTTQLNSQSCSLFPSLPVRKQGGLARDYSGSPSSLFFFFFDPAGPFKLLWCAIGPNTNYPKWHPSYNIMDTTALVSTPLFPE